MKAKGLTRLGTQMRFQTIRSVEATQKHIFISQTHTKKNFDLREKSVFNATLKFEVLL